ncbi:MAG: YhjD/YihY/BrkB family envelope integrity protein [Planctomycetota bacterium]|jgi:membrane protein
MSPQLKIPTWVRRLFTSPVGELSRWQRAVRWFIELSLHCARALRRDKAPQMAAALTYHLLFSMLPTIVIMLMMLNVFVGPEDRLQFKRNAIQLFVDSIVAEPSSTDPNTTPANTPDTEQEFQAVTQQLNDRVQGYIDKLEQVNLSSIGVIGVLVFIYGATALLATIERSFNAILGVSASRPWYVRLPLYYTTITLAPILMLAAQVIQSALFNFLDEGLISAWTQWFVGPLAVAMPLLAMWLVLFLMYSLIPNTSVPKQHALAGALVGAVLWVIAKEGFRLYVTGGTVTTLYGALALLPLFLLWLYISWLIILFGIEIVYSLGALRTQHWHLDADKRPEDQLFDPVMMLPLAAHIARAFETGRSPSLTELSQALNLPHTTTRRMLESLQDAGLVNPVTKAMKRGYALARPADHIPTREILSAAHNLLPKNDAAPLPSDPASTTEAPPAAAYAMIDRLYEAGQAASEQTTLADLCEVRPDSISTPAIFPIPSGDEATSDTLP